MEVFANDPHERAKLRCVELTSNQDAAREVSSDRIYQAGRICLEAVCVGCYQPKKSAAKEGGGRLMRQPRDRRR